MITLIISGICVVVMFLQATGVMSYSSFAIVPSLVKQGEFYRLLTAALMHGSYYHIIGNLGAFTNVGTFIEQVYGRKRYILILAAAMLGSGLMITFLGEEIYTIGLSGVVWGVFGAYVSYLFKNDGRFDSVELSQIARMLIPNIIISFIPGVSWQGHFGGFIAGLVMSMILPLKQVYHHQQYNYIDRQNEENADEDTMV